MKPLRVGTVFSGIGAVEHALLRMKLPHKIIFACDNNKFVKQSYIANYKPMEWYDDIMDLDGMAYRDKLDLLAGGPPCQSFSMIGKRAGIDDPRGLLTFKFLDLIRDSQPRMFIFENVKGLLNHDKGCTWRKLYRRFEDLEYNVSWEVLNSKDYGIPQHRDRLFVVGFKNGDVARGQYTSNRAEQQFKFPDKKPLVLTMQDMLEDAPPSKYFLPEKGIKFVTSEKNLAKKYTQIDGNVQLCQKANQQFNWHGHFITNPRQVDTKYTITDNCVKYALNTRTKNYAPVKTDLEVAQPLLQSIPKCHRTGVDNVTDERGLRKLTPRECLRLMGFDDTFKIVVSDLQAYRQSGNSIVVDVLIMLIAKMLKYERNCNTQTSEVPARFRHKFLDICTEATL